MNQNKSYKLQSVNQFTEKHLAHITVTTKIYTRVKTQFSNCLVTLMKQDCQ